MKEDSNKAENRPSLSNSAVSSNETERHMNSVAISFAGDTSISTSRAKNFAKTKSNTTNRSSSGSKKLGLKLRSKISLAKRNDAKHVGLGYIVSSNRGRGCATGASPSFRNSAFGERHGKLEMDEWDVRQQVERTFGPARFIRDLVASFLAFIVYLITMETILSCALTIALTIVWYKRYGDDLDSSWNGGGLDWIVLGFAVVTPVTVAIGLAFRRRELALLHITRVRSSIFQIYLGHSIWDWRKAEKTTSKGDGDSNTMTNVKKKLLQKSASGRDSMSHIDWEGHSDKVLQQLVGIGDELCRFLTLPTATRTSHRMLKRGRREAASIVEVAYRLFDSLYTQRITKLTMLTEDLKSYGLSPSEASRIRQYERILGEAVEGLRMIKMYRTPLALRSFGRIFTMVLPPLYSPKFAQIAFDLESLAFGILFSLVTPLCLTALFESMRVIEDPFVGSITLDGIDVKEEFEVLNFHQLINARMTVFPDASPFEERSTSAIDIYSHNEAAFESMYCKKTMDQSNGSRKSNYFNSDGSSFNGSALNGSSRMSHFAASMMEDRV